MIAIDTSSRCEEDRAEVRARRLHVGAEELVRELLDQDAQAERREDRDEEVAVDNAEDHEPVEQPADDVHQARGRRHAEDRRHAGMGELDHDVAAEHHELALRDVDHVHHAPDERHAVRDEREQRADQNAVDEQLQRERRRVDEQRQLGHRVGSGAHHFGAAASFSRWSHAGAG